MSLKAKHTLWLILLGLFTGACEKEIEVELPPYEPQLVVEGSIEQGQPPLIFLTTSAGYFDRTDLTFFENSFVHDAECTVTANGQEYALEELCAEDIPNLALPLIAEFLGISEVALREINYCIYTVPLNDFVTGQGLIGELNTTYDLTIRTSDGVYTSTTHIPDTIPLDSIWYEPRASDSLEGIIWATLTDPDTIGNAYRWQARRLNVTEGFIAPFNSAFRDEFINGTTFDFGYIHGDNPNTPDGQQFYIEGDTVVVKFSQIDKQFYRFLRVFEDQVVSNGNPFSSPTTIPTNIEGGALGIWGGYAALYDTIYALKNP